MKILFFADNFPPEINAPATRVYERACYWVKWGHDVTVLTSVPNFPEGKVYSPYRNRWYQTEDMNGIRVVRVKTFMRPNQGTLLRTLDFLSYMVMAFLAGLFQPRPDVVVSTSPQFFCAVSAWGVSKLRRLPYVFELGDLWPKQIVAVGVVKRSFAITNIEKLELFLYREAARIVVLTNAFKEDLTSRGIEPSKISVVINGVDLGRYSPRDRDKDLEKLWNLQRKFVVGYIGTHGLSHQLENVLNTAERLKSFTDIQFLFVGSGAAREGLIMESKKRGLQNVIFAPPQPKHEIQRFWSVCNVALIHLKDDPLFATVIPSKTFEAMAMGLPLIVAAPRGEVGLLVEREMAGVWVPPADPDALAAAVLSLRTDSAKNAAFSKRSHAASRRYTRERQARDFLAALETIFGSHEPLHQSAMAD